MYLLFSWFCFLQTSLLFSVLAQNSGETPGIPEVKQESLANNEEVTTKKYDTTDRFISHNEKPAIFGSHAYNPITQEFEDLAIFNETLAHNTSAFHHHSHHPIPETTEATTPTQETPQEELTTVTEEITEDPISKSPGRLGRYRGLKKLNRLQSGGPVPKIKVPWSAFRNLENGTTTNYTDTINTSNQMPYLPYNDTLHKIIV